MWTLIHAGVEQTFEDWGFGQLKRTLASQGPDYVTFQHANAQSMTDTQLFTRGDIIEVWRDRIFSATDKKFSGGTRFFYGLVIEVPRTGAGDSESLEYKIAGPWWYLEHKVYEQTWYFFRQYTVPTDPRSPPLYNELTTSHIIINQKILKQGQLPLPGQYLKLSTGQQIRDVLEWCRSLRTEGTSDFIRIAPFDIGDEFPSLDLNLWTLTNPNTNIPTDQAVLDALDGISPNVDVPLDVDVDKACSEIIRKQLRWAPDSVTWFDYTTTPYPTFHCKRRRSLPKTDVPFSTDPITGEDGPVAGLSVSPRYDLQVPMVKITFEFAVEVGSFSFTQPIIQIAPQPAPPPADQFGAMVATISMIGEKIGELSTNIVTTPIALEDINFWAKYQPSIKLANPDAQIIVGTGVRGIGNNYPNKLDDGQIPPWMPVSTEKQTIHARMQGTRANTTSDVGRVLSMDITATTASTGNYVSQFIEQIPEPLPSNLAGQVYDSVKDLTYSGSIRLEEDEVSETIGIGMVFNVTNGAIEWSTMNALVVSITEDVDAGVTEAQFGPPQHLGVADLVELMRVARNRKLTPALFWRTGTSVSQDQALQLGDFTGGQDTAPADDYQDRSVITPMPDPTAPPPPITSGIDPTSDGTTTGIPTIILHAKLSDETRLIVKGDGGSGVVAIDLADFELTGNLQDQNIFDMRIREWDVCIVDPSTGAVKKQKALFLSTKPYNPPP